MNQLSIVIPVKSSDSCWESLVHSLLAFNASFEIILVGPDFKNKTSTNEKVRFVYSSQGRARQLNTGAKAARHSLLWFLHADTKIKENNLTSLLSRFKENPNALYFFDLTFSKTGPKLMSLNALGVWMRSRWLKMPFGDQGLVMSKKVFYQLGQFDLDAPYGEDHLLVWRAHQHGIDIVPVNETLETSPRKYQDHGWLKTTLTHVYLTYKQAFPEWLKTIRPHKRPAVAIFVKTPGVSTVKSRLASVVGKEKAEEFFHLSLKATEAVAAEAAREAKGELAVYWAVAENAELGNPLWANFSTISQGEGDLGERLHHIYSTLQKKHSSVYLIGADLPHLPAERLIEATKKIEQTDYVMGETDDGGFYLFGGKKPIDKKSWKAIPYSTDETAAKLIEELNRLKFSFLPKEFDVDFYEDLIKLNSLERKNLLPEQDNVFVWLKEFLKTQK
nr:TIGR04282 family arsenosugar biosynthesis glycosyltransferase [Bacteriovorax sp. HI3]